MLSKKLLTELIVFFEEFTSSIKSTDFHISQIIEQRISHSYRVMDHIEKLCSSLEMDEEELLLAKFIALYHDIGRLEQYNLYKSFSDKDSENHASLSIKVIEKNNLDEELNDEEKNILKGAILLHNQPQLPKKEDPKILFFTRLLRDVDKLDLWHLFVDQFSSKTNANNPFIDPNLSTLSKVSDKVYEDVMENKQVNLNDIKTQVDYKLLLMSMVFDLNFKYSFKVVNQHQYIKKLYDTMPKSDRIIDSFRNIRIHIENQFLL